MQKVPACMGGDLAWMRVCLDNADRSTPPATMVRSIHADDVSATNGSGRTVPRVLCFTHRMK